MLKKLVIILLVMMLGLLFILRKSDGIFLNTDTLFNKNVKSGALMACFRIFIASSSKIWIEVKKDL